MKEQFHLDLYKKGVERIEEFAQLGKADIHIHSNYSDAQPSIEDILEYVEHKTDLDVIAITDHDRIDGAMYAVEIAKTKNYRFEIVVGEEVSTKEGHILGLFLKKPIAPHQSVHETIKDIKAQDGVAVASHPFSHTRMNGGRTVLMDGIGLLALLKEKDNLDGIETVNATPTLSEENLSARLINSTAIFKAETGSSDAHILDAIGKGYTVFEGKTAGELKAAILHTQTRAMNSRWTFFALMKYAYFFLPKGLRLLLYTILHGRKKRKQFTRL